MELATILLEVIAAVILAFMTIKIIKCLNKDFV